MSVNAWVSGKRQTILLLLVFVLAPLGRDAVAQTSDRPVQVQGFVEFGQMMLKAEESFKAVFGKSRSNVIGGGGQLTFRRWVPGLFVGVGLDHQHKTGERAFVYNGNVFPLGIETKSTITPTLISAGYKLSPFGRVSPYVGGGFGSYRYKETSEFADPAENVDDRFTGYHLFGGAEIAVWRFVSAGADLRWTTVPDAVGAGGLSEEFDEDNLGGISVRFKLLVGR